MSVPYLVKGTVWGEALVLATIAVPMCYEPGSLVMPEDESTEDGTIWRDQLAVRAINTTTVFSLSAGNLFLHSTL